MLEEAIKCYLEELVGPLIGAGRVFPVFGTAPMPFVTYSVTVIEGGVVKESQVEVKVIADDYATCIDLRDLIASKMDMNDQSCLISSANIVFRSELAGGGAIFNEAIQVWELSQIFLTNWRVKNEQ